MKKLTALAALAVIVTAVGCSGSAGKTSPVMPEVVGLQLDAALAEIDGAGIPDDVAVEGGGTFGIIDESNWQVCTQSPPAGTSVTSVPKLTVERACVEEGGNPAPPPTEVPPATEPATVAPPPTEVLTIVNSPDLAAVLSDGNNCSDRIAQFATVNQGRTIEFDGNVAALGNSAGDTTRYDILVQPGDFSTTSAVGPSFQFQDVNVFDLGLTGPNIPADIEAGINIRVVAVLGEYNSTNCLFQLLPVSTQIR